MNFLDAANRQQSSSATEPLFRPIFRVEINLKARQGAGLHLSDTCCQFIDINTLLSKEDKNKLMGMDDKEDKWKFLTSVTLEETLLCSRHTARSGLASVKSSFCMKNNTDNIEDCTNRRLHI